MTEQEKNLEGEAPHSKLLPAGKSAYGRTWVPNDDKKSTSLSRSTFFLYS